VIKKSAVRSRLRDNKSILYNYLIAENVTRRLIDEYERIDHVNLHLDLSMSRGSRDHFDNYFSEKLSWVSQITKTPLNITSHVFHDYSHHEPCVQIADYIAGAIYQMYEHGDGRYYEMIKNKILYTNAWGVSIE
jgi:wobble nucleotide-excising tRNase